MDVRLIVIPTVDATMGEEPMRAHKSLVRLCLLFPTFGPGIVLGQNESEFDVKAVAKDMENRFRACPRREVVAQFDRKHHKQVWQKQAMGPPSDVFVDIKQNDSLLWPDILTVEFTLRYAFGPERQSKQDAQEDSQLEVELAVGKLLTTRYRNTYLISRDAIRLKAREFLPTTLDGRPSTWKERSVWPDACWDQIAAK